jgi:hypothetical protein
MAQLVSEEIMQQRIIAFDEVNCQVVLSVEGIPPYAIDLPIDEEGNTLEGDALREYLRGFYPLEYFERKNRLKDGVKNAAAVRGLVDPLPVTQPTNEELAIAARQRRDVELASSDWTQLVDVQMPEEVRLAWQEYRQSLRDITTQTTFPTEIVWPLRPEQEAR